MRRDRRAGEMFVVAALSSLAEMISVNYKNFGQTLAMAKVELVKRYSGSLLGIFWAIVRPMLFIGVYWFAIQVGLRGNAPVGDAPFLLWFLPGIICWFFISDALTIGGAAIRGNSHLVTKMVYPVATIPVFTVLSLYFVHLMLVGVLVAIFILSGYGLSLFFLEWVYYTLCTLIFALVVSTLLSTLTAISRDVGHMVKSIMTVLFWLTPIIWSLDALDGIVKKVVMLNPVCYLVQGYRNAFVLERWFFVEWEYTLYFWVLMAGLTLFTSFLWSKLHDEFADIL